jgi:pSer/pThr/pTyr-binding forkhead associated (FHA) protein
MSSLPYIHFDDDENPNVLASSVDDDLTYLVRTMSAVEYDEKKRLKQARSAGLAKDDVLAAAYFMVQKEAGGKWKRKWVEYGNGLLTYKREKLDTKRKYLVGYAERETAAKPDESKQAVDELYFSALEKANVDVDVTFKVYTSKRVLLLRAENLEDAETMVDVMQRDIKSRMSSDLWAAKAEASTRMAPLLKQQFVHSLELYEIISTALSKSGLADISNVGPLSTKNKNMKGVLQMRDEADSSYESYEFVIWDKALYYFNTGQITPQGFVSLSQVSISLDFDRLAKHKFTFSIQTPWRSLVVKCKHAVSLSEWIATLEALILTKDDGSDPRSAEAVLSTIKEQMESNQSYEAFFNNHRGAKMFRAYLNQAGANGRDYDFLSAVSRFRRADKDKVAEKANKIFEEYFVNPNSGVEGKEGDATGKSAIDSLDEAVLKRIKRKIQEEPISQSIFSVAKKVVGDVLAQHYEAFRKTEEFKKVNDEGGGLERDVQMLDPTLDFVITVVNDGKSKTHKLKPGTATTLGRDAANMIVVDDENVSRNHCRLEVDDVSVTFIDVGSSSGSKLNGTSIQKAKLQPGDEVIIGSTTVTFEQQAKKKGLLSKLGM